MLIVNLYPALMNHPAGLEHGYGIQNIENTVNKYYGIMRITKNDAYKTDILIPIRNDV
jgi:sensor histidine kinase YesM